MLTNPVAASSSSREAVVRDEDKVRPCPPRRDAVPDLRVAEGARITPFVITIALMPDIEPPVSRVNRTPARVRVSQMAGV